MANRDNRGVTFERVEFLGENDTVYESRLNLRIVAKAILSPAPSNYEAKHVFSFLDERSLERSSKIRRRLFFKIAFHPRTAALSIARYSFRAVKIKTLGN